MNLKNWTPGSWKNRTALQQANYADENYYQDILSQLKELPPLVFSGEVEKLKKQIGEAGQGKMFILQGGDCAERFIDCKSETIVQKIKILLQMSVILNYGAKKPVVRIGRIAGQYAKPRSKPTETVNGTELPSYRGDIINGYEATPEARKHDPVRLLKSYFRSTATINFIRAMLNGGWADMHHPGQWNLRSFEKSTQWEEYKTVTERILDAINFMESFGGIRSDAVGRTMFYTSHEGLLLGYEEALTRKSPLTGKYYNMGAHMLWIGDRTRQIDGAHVEYFRGINNPIGFKVGPSIEPDELTELLEILNPANEPGRITLISRFGEKKVDDMLPRLVKAIKKSGKVVTWSCDPMHGNGMTTDDGTKTRDFKAIESEIRKTYRILNAENTHLAGVHFEMTGEDVTECIGGSMNIKHHHLANNYETYCDPRLNYSQSLEIAFLITKLLGEEGK